MVLRQAGQHYIVSDHCGKHKPRPPPVLGHHAYSCCYGVSWAFEVYFPAVYEYFSRIRPALSEYRFHNLGASRAYKAGYAKYFSLIRGKGYVLIVSAAGEILNAQRLFSPRMRFPVVVVLHLAAHHAGDYLVLRNVLYHAGGYEAAVPEHRRPVAHFEYLLHPVRYIYNCDILFLQHPYLLKKRCDFVFRKRGGGFVHYDNLGVFDYYLCDLRHLLLCGGKVAGKIRGLYIHLHEVQHSLRIGYHFFLVNEYAVLLPGFRS